MYGAPPKKKSKLPLILGLAGAVVVILIAVIIIAVNCAGNILGQVSAADYYEIGNDKIPTVTRALGEERKVVSIDTSSSGSTKTQVIVYEVSGTEQNNDMLAYGKYLKNNDGFLPLQNADFSGPTGSCVSGRNSVDEGFMVRVGINFDTNGYTISIALQEGNVSPIDTPSESGALDTGPEPDTGPGPDTGPKPDSPPSPPTGRITDGIFEIFNTGAFFMKLKILNGEAAGTVMDVHVKDNMSAVVMSSGGLDIRVVIRDGKSYTINDTDKTLYIYELDPEVAESTGWANTGNLTFVGTGSDEFNGKTLSYDEFKDPKDQRTFYFMDGNTLVGMRSVSEHESSDVEVLELNTNISDKVFDIPTDYDVLS